MELYLKITAGLLLIVHAFHLASLQDPTDSPGRTIDKSWLRELAKNTAGSLNAAVTGEKAKYDQEADATASEPSNDYSGIASGSMAAFNAEEENLSGHESGANNTSDDLNVVATTLPPAFTNGTTKQPELPDATVSPNTTTAHPTSSSHANVTEAEDGSHNSTTTLQTSTTHLISQNSTSFPDFSNRTDLQSTTSPPERNATQESTTRPKAHTGLTNSTSTGSTNTTAVTTTASPETNKTSTLSSSTTVLPSETTETSPATTTAAAPNTPEKANKTDKDAASGSSSERGLASDPHRSNRNGAWGAVLGTAVAVAIVGLVAYVILKKKHQKAFSHRKLVEEYPSDPVLRLDNSDPLDLNFGGSAYYNPGLQGDNIQMTNFPGRQRN
ncbi:mucin-15 [Seriola lalandi dorsalis]|uniref:Mucin 15, cell surface associated n=1 Tax=Seriola lalandi dorsalis TaxID=1841481 RepID=A0A3B4X4Q4_SERLL|nr:mucin-15 [Seriola lalandi dorsalis]